MTPYLLFQNTFIWRRPRVAIFADIIKFVILRIKTIFKDSKILKELEIMYQNAIYICIFWYSKVCWFPVKKYWCQAEIKACVTWFLYFLHLLQIRYNCAKFHHCRMCEADFREVDLFAHSIHEQSKKDHLNSCLKVLIIPFLTFSTLDPFIFSK